MSGSSWVERAAARIEAWPVGPIAALMLGAATAFFCWAMPTDFVNGLIPGASAVAGRALIAAPALMITLLTWGAFRWLDARYQPDPIIDEGDDEEDWLTPSSRQPFVPIIVRPEPVVRPLILDAIADFPLRDLAPAPVAVPAHAAEQEADELLLDNVLEAEPHAPIDDSPLAVLMERLAAELAPATHVAPQVPANEPDDEMLRATIADLHRLAAHRA